MSGLDSVSPKTAAQNASEQTSNGELVSPVKAKEDVNPTLTKKIAEYEARNAKLQHQIQEIQEKQREVDSQLRTKDPQALVDSHIRRLHQYNEIRDVGQGLMGMIAEQRGVRVVDVYKDFGIGDGD